RRLGELLRALSSDLLMHPRVPLWSLMREAAGARRQAERWRVSYPDWIDPGFAERCGCADRWNASLRAAPSIHPFRPRGYASLGSPNWQSLFDECDVQGAMAGTEMRHPFLDIRLLRYMLAVPAM